MIYIYMIYIYIYDMEVYHLPLEEPVFRWWNFVSNYGTVSCSHWPHHGGFWHVSSSQRPGSSKLLKKVWQQSPQQWRFTENYWGLLCIIYIYIYYVYIYIYLYRYIDIHDDLWCFMMYMLLHSSPWQFHHELHDFWTDCWNYVTKIRKHNESQWLFLWHQHTSRLS